MSSCKKKYIIKPTVGLSKGDKGDKGDPGEDASFILPLDTDDIVYRGSVLTTVIDGLLYLPLAITGFSAATTSFEKGQVLTSLQFSWAYNKGIVSQSITGSNVTSPSLLTTDRTKLVTLNNITNNTNILLTADDVTGDTNPPKTAQITLLFFNKLYYGKSTIGTINSAFALALTGELKSNRTKTFTTTTGLNEYIWFFSPVAYGLASFKTNGFNGGLDLVSTFNLTNASGYLESYYAFRSTNHSLGITVTDVL